MIVTRIRQFTYREGGRRRQFSYRDLSNMVLSVPMLRIRVENVGGELKVSVLRRYKVLAGPNGGETLDSAAHLCVQQLAGTRP